MNTTEWDETTYCDCGLPGEIGCTKSTLLSVVFKLHMDRDVYCYSFLWFLHFYDIK